MDWWATIGVVAGAMLSLLALIGTIARMAARIAAPHFAAAVRAAINDELALIRRELEVNGGESLKDVVDDIRRDLKAHLSNRQLEDSDVWQALAALGYDRRARRRIHEGHDP